MRVVFWGTRGSLAKPGPTTVRYGGNTACVEVRAADGTLIVLDCGTGAHELGLALVASTASGLRGHILITHTHWDHIQGFPFFAPVFRAGDEWDLYAPGGLGQHLERTLAGQMEYTYFPVTLQQLSAHIRYHDLVEGAFDVGGVRVIARYTNHPALALSYRLEAGGVAVVYATDHEPHSPDLLDPPGPDSGGVAPALHPEDRRHVAFLAGADLVIHDAQYTIAEYADKIGWGHTPIEKAVDFAVAAGARCLALFHHDPLHDDATLDRLVMLCQRRAVARSGTLSVIGAREGQAIDLPERSGENTVHERPAEARGAEGRSSPDVPAAARVSDRPSNAATTILIADDEPAVRCMLETTLQPEGYRLLTAPDGSKALDLVRREHPALVVLDQHMPPPSGIEVCRAIRADPDATVRNVPVLMMTSLDGADDTAAGFAAGASDYITKLSSGPYIRTRVRGWLLRSGAG